MIYVSNVLHGFLPLQFQMCFLIDDDPVMTLNESESLQYRVMTVHSIFDDVENSKGFLIP